MALSRCRVVSIQGNLMEIDAFADTPLLDFKPRSWSAQNHRLGKQKYHRGNTKKSGLLTDNDVMYWQY
jgi:tRNA (Thr-GGU) A37 N-methylase